MTRARISVLAPVMAALLALGACGDDSSGDASDADVEAAAGDDPSTDADTGEAGTDTAADDGGTLPDACTLVEDAEVEALIGAAEGTGEADTAIDGLDYSQCIWENEDGLFVVAVVDGPERYRTHTENLPGEPLGGVGEEAITAPGVSSETKGATGGRTISALVDDRTLVVALEVEGETTVEMVAPIATTVAGRLP